MDWGFEIVRWPQSGISASCWMGGITKSMTDLVLPLDTASKRKYSVCTSLLCYGLSNRWNIHIVFQSTSGTGFNNEQTRGVRDRREDHMLDVTFIIQLTFSLVGILLDGANSTTLVGISSYLRGYFTYTRDRSIWPLITEE